MTELDELLDEYRELLREGKTKEATDVAKTIREKQGRSTGVSNPFEDGADEEPDREESSTEVADDDVGVDAFGDLKGIGDELALELEDEFGDLETLADSDVEDLEPIPGIGEKRAENILDQLR